MPGLTVTTDIPAANVAAPAPPAPAQPGTSSNTHHTSPQRTSSPTRPPVSPITPTLGPKRISSSGTSSKTTGAKGAKGPSNSDNSIPDDPPNFALGRPAFAHSQPDQVAIAPPAAEPIAFDDNPDVLALKSAISILQLQRARATADMQALSRAKAAALADPGAFVADLAAGKVGMDGDPLMLPGGGGDSDGSDDDSEEDYDSSPSSPSSSDGEESIKPEPESESGSDSQNRITTAQTDTDGDVSMTGDSGGGPDIPTTTKSTKSNIRKKRKGSTTTNPDSSSSSDNKQKARGATENPAAAWRKLPKPQTVVRCPPVNWAQYGIVGESLDKLHAEQVAAPTLGAPAVLGPGATYQFKGGDAAAAGARGGRLVGIAAPYTPGRDKIDKKAKGGRR
ncbi:hypothetical protein B0H63DRAFT_485074 [Podospora didyma]|uniref:Uncharacterized protein n=1 Tax=Podospora didyma TaxID=330526 RepID=A0AAE0KAG9_9PEZI|nr:hypothetical protein B0H63DRAFT_485074 [Podospora didyma]